MKKTSNNRYYKLKGKNLVSVNIYTIKSVIFEANKKITLYDNKVITMIIAFALQKICLSQNNWKETMGCISTQA